MRNLSGHLILATVILFSIPSFAATDKKSDNGGGGGMGSLSKLFPHPMVSVSYGYETTDVKDPVSGVAIGKGQSLRGSFAFNIHIADLVLGYSYSQLLGTANYSFTDTTTAQSLQLTGTGTKFKYGGPYIGLRETPFESIPIHPYLEAGGFAGLGELSFPDAQLANPSSFAKFSESQAFAGPYAEAGLEIRMMNKLMIAGGARYSKIATSKFVTLNNQKLSFESTVVFGTVGVRY